jgi:hypothetical protein
VKRTKGNQIVSEGDLLGTITKRKVILGTLVPRLERHRRLNLQKSSGMKHYLEKSSGLTVDMFFVWGNQQRTRDGNIKGNQEVCQVCEEIQTTHKPETTSLAILLYALWV